MTGKSGKGHMEVIERIYNDIPSFSDVFSEETFYIFAFCFVVGTCMLAFILSRCITIKPVD